MRVGVLFTGGKDSTYSVYKALENGMEVKYLITIVSENPHSWMFHRVNIHHTPAQAEAMGIKQLLQQTSGEKEKELLDLERMIRKIERDIDGLVSGTIASTYQKERIDKICRDFGLVHFTPLWGRNPLELLREMVASGFETIITAVAAEGFTEKWLGRKLDEECIKDLAKLHNKFKINIAGEGGEYESLVLDAPFFKSRLEIAEAERVWNGTSGYYLVKKVKVVRK